MEITLKTLVNIINTFEELKNSDIDLGESKINRKEFEAKYNEIRENSKEDKTSKNMYKNIDDIKDSIDELSKHFTESQNIYINILLEQVNALLILHSELDAHKILMYKKQIGQLDDNKDR